jgi:ribosomal protein L7/L12
VKQHEYESLLQEALRLVELDAPDEDLLRVLRESGANKTESIKIVKTAKALELRQADDLVHYSATWADRRTDDEAAMDSFLDSVGDTFDLS